MDLTKTKEIANRILYPIKVADDNTNATQNFLFSAIRSKHSNLLPEYYLIYFLLKELLEFKDLGKFEKLAWSFPIDYNGKAFLIEHRKFGVGVFIQEESDEKQAKEIAIKLKKAINSVRPFFDYVAEQAVIKSQLTVKNNSSLLFSRFKYFTRLYNLNYRKFKKYEGKYETKTINNANGLVSSTSKALWFEHYQNCNHLAISAIEAFFSWTEHIFVHISILKKNIAEGEKVAKLIGEEWKVKYTTAIDISDIEANKYYNDLLLIRSQLRNYVAHGAFGKNGNAFDFHSGAGAVPVLMNHTKKSNKYSLHGKLSFNEKEVMLLLEQFIKFIHKGRNGIYLLHVQKYELPTILPYCSDGTYTDACRNRKSMNSFCFYLMHLIDNARNMD